MKTLAQNDPLTDAAFDRLGDFLEGCKSGKAMNLEQLDGCFAAMIAGLETVMPSEYNREVFGGEKLEFSNVNEAREILSLLMRHWNTIAGTLHKGEPYVPLLLEDENGVAHGNDWARGFMRGMNMRRDGWTELVDDDEHGGCLIPMMMLCHEHDKDPEMRPDPIPPKKRERSLLGWRRDNWKTSISGSSGMPLSVHPCLNPGVVPARSGATIRARVGRGRNTSGAAARRR